MANTFKANVIRVDTTAAFTNALSIETIKYIGSSSGSASIKAAASASGSNLWEQAGSANWTDSNVHIKDTQGVYVTVTNSAVVYLYLK